MSNFDPYDIAFLGKVIKLSGSTAIVNFGGINREVEVGLVDVKEGDYVLAHAGYAIKVIAEDEINGNLFRIINELR
ncbi:MULTISPECIES: HypC/HybG/HupF family hydrogenase formation chaperone [Acidianus]|uniref:Hydrogenase accessory protein n=1 Tax=Candidatus Acidianus copahuensis TaxID=1160895 RepID=A0A031LK94_9CREN|nr:MULTISPECIES: HypC/HybG/HupF family hydrogenase formation chaperone [Acidianus]EZQ01966.1 hydrogenase accessory protein [Candidatus Acidianus copahuensis]NON61731.1 HypC/HybG/HupF family hydrogenase formation chaperone [Acidianus sp. RZ1]